MSIKIKYGKELMKFKAFFETMTHTPLKDCLIDSKSQIVFLVKNGSIGKAIGKNGKNARGIEAALNRKIKIVEFSPVATEFVKSLISPLKAEISEENNTILIHCGDSATRSLLIGRNARNLRNYESITKRYFEKILKVI